MPPDPVRADLEACRAVLRAGSRSFSLASLLLPRRVRDPAAALYAFCRVADDAVDDDPRASDSTIAELRARLDRAYAGTAEDSPIDRALAWAVRAHRIPRAPLDALLEGFAWDAEGRRYESLDDLYGYATRVAGTVGVMMTVLMGTRDEEVLARACDLGVAMQLTNIARDVGEDARRGRVYLPLAWLRAVGVEPDVLVRDRDPSPALRGVVARLLAEAEVLYRRADAGITRLPLDCRMAIRAARLVYAEIGRGVAGAGYDSVTRRAVVPRWRKLWLLARAAGALFWRPRRLADPALEPARFLVGASAEGA